MMYAVYDETGRITQANQVYDPNPKLEPIMRDLGQVWVKADRSLVSPDEWFVVREQLRERPSMSVLQSKRTIKAGGNDSAVLTGIPRGARCVVSSSAHALYNVVMDDDELEVLIPVPCIYTIKFTLWPFRDAVFEVEAVA